jgi:hypothetical protein
MAQLIQVQTGDDTPSLDEAERALVAAHKFAPEYIDALQELAHYYDAVADRPVLARRYATLCLQLLDKAREEMIRITEEDQ